MSGPVWMRRKGGENRLVFQIVLNIRTDLNAEKIGSFGWGEKYRGLWIILFTWFLYFPIIPLGMNLMPNLGKMEALVGRTSGPCLVRGIRIRDSPNSVP